MTTEESKQLGNDERNKSHENNSTVGVEDLGERLSMLKCLFRIRSQMCDVGFQPRRSPRAHASTKTTATNLKGSANQSTLRAGSEKSRPKTPIRPRPVVQPDSRYVVCIIVTDVTILLILMIPHHCMYGIQFLKTSSLC